MITDSIHVAFMHLRVDRLRASLFKDGCQHVQLQIRGCERRLEETGGPCLSMWPHIILLHHSVAEFLGTLPFFLKIFTLLRIVQLRRWWTSPIFSAVHIFHSLVLSAAWQFYWFKFWNMRRLFRPEAFPKARGQEPANGNTQCCRNNSTIRHGCI